MIDIVRIWFREHVRERIPTQATFAWGAAFGLSFSAPYTNGWWIAVTTASVLMVWDIWLTRGEAVRRKAELYDYYRSEFTTDYMKPVKLVPLDKSPDHE